jgi:hypothetical protein
MDGQRSDAISIGMILLWALLSIAGSNLVFDYTDDFQVRYTADIAVLFWLIAVLALLFEKQRFARLNWTLGWIGFVIHLDAAFGLAHHWSHAKAFEHVREVSGYGEGIFASYLFTLVWTADVIWWWASPRGYAARPRWVGYMLHGFMGFIFINATVVYETGYIRWAGIVGTVLVLAVWLQTISTTKPRGAHCLHADIFEHDSKGTRS